MKEKFTKVIKTISINLIVLFSLLLIIENFVLDVPLNSEVKLNESRSIYLREHKLNSLQTFDNLWLSDNFETAVFKPSNIIRTDDQGHIIGPKEIDDYNKLLYFIGGSTTESAYVDEDKRFPYLVQEKLTPYKLKTINAGVGGQNSKQGYLSFITKGIKLSPDFLILMFNVNDISLLTKTGTYDSGIPGRSLLIEKNTSPSNKSVFYYLKRIKDQTLPRTWFLFRKHVLGYTNNLMGKERDEFNAYRDNKIGKGVVLDLYKKSILNYIMYCEINDIELILMTQFNRIENKSPAFVNGYGMFPNQHTVDEFIDIYKEANKILIELSSEYNISLIDLNKLVPKEKDFMYDSVHLTDKGSILVAEIISNKIEGLIK